MTTNIGSAKHFSAWNVPIVFDLSDMFDRTIDPQKVRLSGKIANRETGFALKTPKHRSTARARNVHMKWYAIRITVDTFSMF